MPPINNPVFNPTGLFRKQRKPFLTAVKMLMFKEAHYSRLLPRGAMVLACTERRKKEMEMLLIIKSFSEIKTEREAIPGAKEESEMCKGKTPGVCK